MFRIFKEFLSYIQMYDGDTSALILNIVGGSLIGITFFIIGIICIAMASNSTRSKRRQRLTTLFGLFLVSCSFSRFLSILCMWHNYAILDGWVKVLTGLLAVFAIVYIPKSIKEALAEKELIEATALLQKTQQDLHEVKKLSEKLTDNK